MPADPSAGALLASAAARLKSGSGPAARLEAELLLGAVLGRRREWLLARPEFPVPADSHRRFAGLVRRRSEGVPVAYLTGRREFAGLEFAVGRGVLIPRPETEGLLERVEAWLGGRADDRPGVVADLGTGSGALAVALARRVGVRVIATDRSATAVRVARRNAAAHGVGHLVEVLRGSWLGPVLRRRPRVRLVAVMSNPPYVSPRLMRRLPPEVRREPRAALAGGGADGLGAVRAVVASARALVPGGLLALEIGAEQGRAVRRLLDGGGWRDARIDPDLAGRDRYALALRPSAGA